MDTRPALHLCEIDSESHLNVFEGIFVSRQIVSELQQKEVWVTISEELTERLYVETVDDAECYIERKAHTGRLSHADLSIAVLARRFNGHVVLTDDLELRQSLEKTRSDVVGTIGILVRACRIGRISKPDLYSRLNALMNDSSMFFSRALYARVLEMLENE